ncbi:jacalin-related lectin 34-like [Raphanus sativus]|uniref:Jacalin-related lectin 34-like n=1 Tax=Raphanus sativus TaxID=3726 RepID=A0A6J0NS91_RAPSA|nr:jacalin-related lectin 34-like [Raphanus sativus]
MSWDDGTHAKVKKVHITYDDVIYSIQVTYGTAPQAPLRGSVGPMSAEFTLESNEYITALSDYALSTQDVITSLTFKTNKKTYGPYGNKYGYQISAAHEKIGKQIAGFHGTEGKILNSIDVHYAPIPTGTGGSEAQKLDAEGGASGAVWDDGAHDNVKKVSVGQGQDGIAAVKFEYRNGSQVVIGADRGTPTLLGYEEFELASDEYITIVEGYYDKILGSDGLTSLTFHTNKNTYGPYGLQGSTHFDIKAEGYKITGFHGRAGDTITAIGVYLAPVGTIPLTPAEPTEKLEDGRTTWDDGVYDKVKKVFIGLGQDGIASVKFEYINGSQVVYGVEHGTPTLPGFEEIVINYPDEHLVSVEGWYDSSNIILGIQFKTNKKTSDYLGFEFDGTGTEFNLQVQNKIIGFHGFSSNHLHSIGAYFVPLPSTTTTIPIVPLKKLGTKWDDSAHEKVKKVFVGLGQDGIAAVKFEYINGSQVVIGVEHGKPTLLGFEEFTLGSYEYITALSAYTKTLNTQDIVTSLTFTTNKKTYGPYGNKSGFQFSFPEESGKQLAGFHGTSDNVLNSIEVHYAPIPAVQKLDAQGGTGGTEWDDGSDHDGVTNITVRINWLGIQYVRFDYVKDGQPKNGGQHGGKSGRGHPLDVVINHPDEHLVSVEGWYDSSNTIMGIQFKTNQKTSDYMGSGFNEDTGTKFILQVQDKKIIGFHGFNAGYLNSIGAYFAPLSFTTAIPIVPSKKLGTKWDDGAYKKVTKVFVGLGEDGIAAVKFDYINDSYRVYGVERGKPTLLGFEEFTLESYEYITALSGYTKTLSMQDVVTSLTFTTNMKTYGPYGNKSGFLFSFPEETGKQIAGFHGTSDNVLNSIDVHYAPIPRLVVQRLNAQGGTGGTEWDDGSDHDGVTNIYVRSNMYGIQYVRFDYAKAGQQKQGDHHGGSTGSRESEREIVINHPDEQVVSVEGWYDPTNVICRMRFRTNQKIYDILEIVSNGSNPTKFTLKVQDKKIIGFHGFSSNQLNSIGAYFAPLSSATTPPIVNPEGA